MQLIETKTRMNADREIKNMMRMNRHIGIHDYIQGLKADEPEVPDAFKQDNGPLEHADLARFYRWMLIVIAPDWKWHLKRLAGEDPKMYGEEYLKATRYEYGTCLYWYDRSLFAFLRQERGKRQRKKMKRRIRSQCRGLTAARNMYEEALGMLGMIGGAE